MHSGWFGSTPCLPAAAVRTQVHQARRVSSTDEPRSEDQVGVNSGWWFEARVLQQSASNGER